MEHTGAGNDNCAHILLWNRPGGSGYDMAAHGKAACVLGRSTGNCYGDDRDPYVMQSFRYRMYEMEKAAKNGFARMLLSRMVVLSVGDLVTVLLCMIMISSKNYASAGMVLLWYLAPLFLIGSFCTGWMQKIEAKFDMEDQTLRCIQICEGACVGLLILQYLLYIKLPSVYGNTGWWIGILVIAAGAMLYQGKKVIIIQS